MGAQTFIEDADTGDLQDAFQVCVAHGLYMNGHAGYTGSIADKDSVVLCGEAENPSAAHDLANALIEADDERISDKWGPAGAIKHPDGWVFFGWASS